MKIDPAQLIRLPDLQAGGRRFNGRPSSADKTT